MNSCLYDCEVVHVRLWPKRYAFRHRMVFFYLDFDELDTLAAKCRWFSRGRWNLYDFREKDHLPLEKLVPHRRGKMMLLTQPRVLGYVFNPVSFYFCFDEKGAPYQMISEVGNTFGELKPYFLGPETRVDGQFETRRPKHYYISPFMDLDVELGFRASVPGERLEIHVDDYKDDRKIFVSTLTGQRQPLDDRRLLKFFFKYPFQTLGVIGLIHWHALKLHLKGITHHRIEEHLEYQKDVWREYGKKRRFL